MNLQATEVVPGEFDVDTDGACVRVLIPAGVGLPGVDEADLAAAVVEELHRAAHPLPPVIDVSQLLTSWPGLLAALTTRFDDDPDGDDRASHADGTEG